MFKWTKFTVLIMVLGIFLAGCSSSSGKAQINEASSSSPSTSTSTETTVSDTWPTKPITLICGYSAGGSSDLGSRYLAAALEKELGQPVIVENVPGSGSWVAWNQLLHNTEADGNTFGLVNLNILFGEYDVENPREEGIDDFELLANHVIDYQVIAIRADEDRFTDFASLVEYSKEHDLLLAVPSVGINSGDSSVATYLTNEFGSKITMVPVDGSADAAAMFLAGDVDFLSGNVGDVLDQDGYKVLVIFADERSKYLPDVPTAKETGVCDYVGFSARGYAYMKGVDPAIVDRMTEALAKAYDDPDYQANMEKMGAELKLYSGQEYTDLLNSQLDSRLKIWGLTRK